MSRRHRKPKADRIDGFTPPDPSSQDYWRSETAKKQMKAFGSASGRMDEVNLDGFVNTLTGIGDWTQDKTYGGQSSGLDFVVTLLSGIDCENRWRGSDLGGRIVETLPDEMTREGWRLQIQPSDDDEKKQDGFPPASGDESQPSAGPPPPLPPQALRLELREIDDEGTQIAQEVADICEDLQFDDRIVEALQYERAFGGAGILIGADDGLELSQPLDLERVRSVDWLNTFRGGWDGEIVAWSYYNDPAAPNYGMPEMYMLRNLGVPVVKMPAPGEKLSSAQLAMPGYASSYGTLISWVHASRFLIFPGTAVSRRARVQMRGWGDSVFTRIDRVLSHYDQTWAGIANLMTEFSQGVLKIDGLAQSLAANNKSGTSNLSNRARAIQQSKSIARMLLIDAAEEYTRETAVLSGVPEMLQQFSLRLAAAADMPVDLLMGQSAAGGLNKGDTTIRFFYDRIKSRQKRRLTPKIKQFISVLFASKNGPTDGNDMGRVSVVHNSLYQMTEGEKADLRLKTNQADDLEIKNQVLLPEEVAASEWAGAEWSANRTIDFEGRAAMAEQDQKDKEARAQQMLAQGGGQAPGDDESPTQGTPFTPFSEEKADEQERVPAGESGGGRFGSGGGGTAKEKEKSKEGKKEKDPKGASKGAARKEEVLKQSAPAANIPYYHGTDIKNLPSILKTGIKPTDASFGKEAKSAWAASNEGLAHAYAGASASRGGSDEYAMLVFASGKDAGLKNFRGDKSAAFSFDTIAPSKIDHVDIYKVGAGKDDKPVRTITKNAAGHFEQG